MNEQLNVEKILQDKADKEFNRVLEEKQKDFFELHNMVANHMGWDDVETKDWFCRENSKIGNFTPLDYYGKQPYRCKCWISNMIDEGTEL